MRDPDEKTLFVLRYTEDRDIIGLFVLPAGECRQRPLTIPYDPGMCFQVWTAIVMAAEWSLL
ncbi:hypothetical protein [Mediterraneibacter glycyrrhizinilyticus]|uniref:hypothetical protein n=1 Tax=Mediterraneibacter glycyrrhizinilyticus TaxID=342942 RepID=UPI0025A41F9B|nr:hypothetical protein [Mediterraneibacter glycyrrhizinilyticus]MDM8126616.1 hypothetical protein [Mediterraneibacter glycyrrhizinilyticus]